jgi:protein ImuA
VPQLSLDLSLDLSLEPVAPAAADPPVAPGAGDPLHPLAALHPTLWRASQLARVAGVVCSSTHPALDVELPGGGWPCRALTELLLPHPGIGELRLLLPALAAGADASSAAAPPVLWFDPPADPSPAVLAALGLAPARLVVVRSRDGARGRARERLPAADVLWALEHTLASGQAAAVLAWLPAHLPADALRRLQLAAAGHPGPAFLLRDVAARLKPSPAPLRLLLRPGPLPDELRVQILKRRGPPPPAPLRLTLPPVLAESARRRSRGFDERSAGLDDARTESWEARTTALRHESRLRAA